MALPKLTTATYEVKLPSNGKVYKYRPFLVKEQKVLLMAMESKDPKQMQKAMEDIIDGCFFSQLDVKKLPPFDLEYLFLKLRAKSVGEVAHLVFKCTNEVDKPVYEKDENGDPKQVGTVLGECGGTIEVDVNLEEVTVDMSKQKSNKIILGETPEGQVGIVLRYPSLDVASKYDKVDVENVSFDFVLAMLLDCIDCVYQGDNIYSRADMDDDEIEDFVGSIPSEKFLEIVEFLSNAPTLSKTVDMVCPKCGNETKYTIEGIDSFFA